MAVRTAAATAAGAEAVARERRPPWPEVAGRAQRARARRVGLNKSGRGAALTSPELGPSPGSGNSSDSGDGDEFRLKVITTNATGRKDSSRP